MALTIEWRRRIDQWREGLKKHFYRPLGTIALSGFVTSEQLTPQEAQGRAFAPMPAISESINVVMPWPYIREPSC